MPARSRGKFDAVCNLASIDFITNHVWNWEHKRIIQVQALARDMDRHSVDRLENHPSHRPRGFRRQDRCSHAHGIARLRAPAEKVFQDMRDAGLVLGG